MRDWLIGLLALALILPFAVGCNGNDGSTGASTSHTAAVAVDDRGCTSSGQVNGTDLFVCYGGAAGSAHGDFVLDNPGSGPILRVSLPPLPGTDVVGHWDWASVSPDSKTILAQWSAECEVPVAFLIGAHGGAPYRIKEAPRIGQSVALGWTPSGRALVVVKPDGCAPGSKPQLLEVSPSGTTLAHRDLTEDQANALHRSTAPRTVAQLLR